MKKIVSAMNNTFVAAVLAIFYILIVGISFLVLRIAEAFKQKAAADSYWQAPEAYPEGPDYFSSPY